MSRINTASRFVALALVFVLVFGITGVMGAEESFRPNDEDLYFEALNAEIAESITTYIVEKRDFYINGSCTARLKPGQSYRVTHGIMNGTVKLVQYFVTTGQTVRKGDPLAAVTVTVDEMSVNNVKSQLEKNKASLEKYKEATEALLNEYEVIKATSKDPEECETASLLYDRLFANYNREVSSREGTISSLQETYDDYLMTEPDQIIYASHTGVIGSIGGQRQGATISAYDLIADIYDLNDITLVVSGGSDILRYNQEVTITQEQGNEVATMTGRVTTCKSAALPSGLISSNDIIELDGDPFNFFFNKDITVKAKTVLMENALVVPTVALQSDSKGDYLFILKDGFTSKRYVVVGSKNSNEAWIVKGVAEGDHIVIK